MRTRPRQISCLLFASLCLPLFSAAQSSDSRYVVSVRELSIPHKASHAFEKGAERLAKHDPAGSLAYFERAAAEFPTYYEAYFEIGMAELELSCTMDAETALRKSIELSGGHYAEPLFALGAVLIDEGKFAESEQVTREALGLDPTSWAGHYCLGWALFRLTRFDEAEKSVREALRLKPDSREALLLLADIHHHQQDYPALLNDLDEYLALKPDSPLIAKVRALRKEAEQAIAASEDTSALVPSQP
jgi:tetratricopeptide (TPR) repeat protein